MQFLKKNKWLFFSAAFLPFIFYIDRMVFLWMRHYKNDVIDINPLSRFLIDSLKYITHGTTFIVIILFILILGRFYMHKIFQTGKVLLIGFLSAGIVAQALKHLLGRARPRLTLDFDFAGPSFSKGYDSFPSGHTTVIFCIAGILSQQFPGYRAVFYIFAAVAGIERIMSGSHFPSDVFAGAIVGLIIARFIGDRCGGDIHQKNI